MEIKIQPLFSAPVNEIVQQLGREIINARALLEAYSLSKEIQLEQVDEKMKTGLSAPWLHIPEIEIEMPVALNYFGAQAQKNSPGFRSLQAGLLNPTFNNYFGFNAAASSTIKITFRSVESPL
ncbi:MAG: hypothetical protein P8184_19615 [Calditrichia bacterium]